jgi:hypothetical protein
MCTLFTRTGTNLLLVYFNFKQHQISPDHYLRGWLSRGFLDYLPLGACIRIWDNVILEGDSFLFQTAIAILSALEGRLLFPDRKELLDILRLIYRQVVVQTSLIPLCSGRHRVATEVALREGISPDDGLYAIYGLDEYVLFERMGELDIWWKDSTWQRLLQRELPDI